MCYDCIFWQKHWCSDKRKKGVGICVVLKLDNKPCEKHFKTEKCKDYGK